MTEHSTHRIIEWQMRKSLFQDLGVEGEKIENKRILQKDLSKKKKKKNLTRQNASENFSVIRQTCLGFGNFESLVTFAGMISVKPDCLKWLDTRTMGLVIFFFFPKKAWLRKKEDKNKNSYKELKCQGKNVFKM